MTDAMWHAHYHTELNWGCHLSSWEEAYLAELLGGGQACRVVLHLQDVTHDKQASNSAQLRSPTFKFSPI